MPTVYGRISAAQAVRLLAYPAQLMLGVTADGRGGDGWLRLHAAGGEVLANDGFAGAGIWAPYKGGVAILMPRSVSAIRSEQGRLMIDNVDRLGQGPEGAAVVCLLKRALRLSRRETSDWDTRRFPSLEVLRASAALGQVSQG